MEKISFVKMSGAGNDFIMIDKDSNPHFDLTEKTIKSLCNRRTGIGADGLITIQNSDDSDFLMDYYNADGSGSTLCGNGARCGIFMAGLSGRIKNGKTIFVQNNINYSGEILDENKVKFNFNPPSDFKQGISFTAGNNTVSACFLNTGSPHVVINIKDILNSEGRAFSSLPDVPVFELGREIRFLDLFAPAGANVNFIAVADNKLFIRTYERGVEDETLACGTGSVAAALIANFIYDMPAPVSLITQGGDELIVDFVKQNGEIKNLSLTGPVKVVFTGKFFLNKFI
jgi:diaminopimelate epimerase